MTRMQIPRVRSWLMAIGIAVVLLAAASPWILEGYWRSRSDNPVRRGVSRARQLGCFSCHGELGRAGIPNQGGDDGVPQWNGSVWMMYVKNDEDIRRYIVDGSDGNGQQTVEEKHDHDHTLIEMPAYGDILDAAEVADLVAAFKVLSGMVGPERGTPAREGYDLAVRWNCFACHAPAGSGGLPNPGSFVGFIPGWYGADFEDLVRTRGEFDRWILDGSIQRLTDHPIAGYFLNRQMLTMPAYRETTRDELDNLWAYAQWLTETDGGIRAEIAAW